MLIFLCFFLLNAKPVPRKIDELTIMVVTKQEQVQPRKKQKLSLESNLVTEPRTAWRDGQSLSSFTDSDDEKALGFTNNTLKNVKGKEKSKKGRATDPQSQYARVIQETQQILKLLV